MKIAVVGAGVAGISAAFNLQKHHEVTIFESETDIGGHANTVPVEDSQNRIWDVDTGFIVFNDRNYPLFSEFLDSLGVCKQRSDMSFSFTDESTGVCYAGTRSGLFPHKKNLVHFGHIKTLLSIFWYSRLLDKSKRDSCYGDQSIRDCLNHLGCPSKVIDDYFIPMAAAIWSCSLTDAETVSAAAYIAFFSNHGLLQITNRPNWHTIKHGSRNYLNAFKESFTGVIHTNSTVLAIEGINNKVRIAVRDRPSEMYDQIVVATHADTAATLVKGLADEKYKVLESFTYTNNNVYLHTDTRYMPSQKNTWASWNVIRTSESGSTHDVFITYYMNRLQSIKSATQFLVSLNPYPTPKDSEILFETTYRHPVPPRSPGSRQEMIDGINLDSKIKFCGAYSGYGFHEDGFRSGKIVADIISSPNTAL